MCMLGEGGRKSDGESGGGVEGAQGLGVTKKRFAIGDCRGAEEG